LNRSAGQLAFHHSLLKMKVEASRPRPVNPSVIQPVFMAKK
jgi:hypothetical protein